MTEEIIIDGVNVAGCKNYVHIEEERYKPECNCRLTTVERGYYCDTYATSVCEEEDCEYKQLKRLEQENKELKEDVLKWQKEFSRQYQINENKGYSKAEENCRSALEEIREMAEKSIKISYNLEVNSMLYDIIDKINEVLNDSEC